MTSNSTCTVLSCRDSNLSTAGNIIGILTFIYAVIGGIYVRSKLITKLPPALSQLKEEVESTAMQAEKLHQRFQSYTVDSPDDDNFRDLIILMERAKYHWMETRAGLDRLEVRRTCRGLDSLRNLLKGATEGGEVSSSLKRTQFLLKEVQLGMMQL
jgi:hypothetical protein